MNKNHKTDKDFTEKVLCALNGATTDQAIQALSTNLSSFIIVATENREGAIYLSNAIGKVIADAIAENYELAKQATESSAHTEPINEADA